MEERVKRFAPVVMILILFATQALAEFPEKHRQLVDQVIELEGSNKMFDAFPAFFDAIFGTKMLTSRNSEEQAKVLRVVKAAIDIELAKKTYRDYLNSHAVDDSLGAVLAWVEAPLGKRLSMAESIGANPTADDKADMVKYLTQLQSSPPSQERIKLIQKLVDVNNADEFFSEATQDLVKAIAKGIEDGLGCKDADVEAIVNDFQKERNSLKEASRQQAILGYFYMYRSFTEQEIEQYIRFMTTKSYRKFEEANNTAMKAGLEVVARNIGRAVGEKGSMIDHQRCTEKETAMPTSGNSGLR